MWNTHPEWHNIVIFVCITAIILTAIVCNTKTRISQQKYDHRQNIAPERFSYKLQKEEQKIRLTAELYRSDSGSEGIQTKSEDHPSSGA